MGTYSDDVAAIRSMPESPIDQPELWIRAVDADAAWQWTLDLLGDAANDPENPIAKLFDGMIADPPADAYEVEQEVLYTSGLEQRKLGRMMIRLVGMAILHQIAAQTDAQVPEQERNDA